jgi:anti-sigma factor RsiW
MTEGHRPDTEQISALAGGELNTAEAAAVRSAIDTDEELRAEYKSLLATASLLSTTPTARVPQNYSALLPPTNIAP